MKITKKIKKQITSRILHLAFANALGFIFTASLPQVVYGDTFTPPPMPLNIQVTTGDTAFLKGHANGTQNYICQLRFIAGRIPEPCGAAISFHIQVPPGLCVNWAPIGPQATLLNHNNEQLITHYSSPNPASGNNTTPLPTWQHSVDTSKVWAQPLGSSSDPSFVAPNAIPWLLLQVVDYQNGPTGDNLLIGTTYIQRLNTQGGIAPASDCLQLSDAGKKVYVDYQADYYFYRIER